MNKVVQERVNSANSIIMAGKARFYKVNLYDPLIRVRDNVTNFSLWDRLQDTRKLRAFYVKMEKAQRDKGNTDFGVEWIKKESFINAEKAFGQLLYDKRVFDLKLIDSILIPFVKECELEELKFNMGALK